MLGRELGLISGGKVGRKAMKQYLGFSAIKTSVSIVEISINSC